MTTRIAVPAMPGRCRPIDVILGRLDGRGVVRPGGGAWMAQCPGHNDRHPSLSIREGDDGRVLLYCHAGCSPEHVVGRLGLTLRDLFACPLPDRLPRGIGPIRAAYRYGDDHLVTRHEPKTFREWHRDGNGWVAGLNGTVLPLYGRSLISTTGPDEWILVVEGEKDCDALIARGFVATTNAGGAGKWRQHHAEVLRGRRVVILPDNDDTGREHANQVAASLTDCAIEIKILELPGLEAKQDVSDWLAAGGTAEKLRALIEAAPSSNVWPSTPVAPSGAPAEPHRVPLFPTDVLPSDLGDYVKSVARALGVAPCMVAVPLLGFAAATIGNTVCVEVKPGWTERLIFWQAVVGQPGSGKSPALDLARQPVDKLQDDTWRDFQEELKLWEQQAKETGGPTAGEKPMLEHFYTTDATKEAIAPLLKTSPGIIIVRDEIAAWVLSFDAYRRAGDRQDWLSLWSGSPLKIDRKTSGSTYVTSPCVSVLGGIQPDRLPRLSTEAGVHDGFLDRFDIVWPESRPLRWTEDEIPDGVAAAVLGRFAHLRPDDHGPRQLRLSPGARQLFGQWVDANADAQEHASGLAAGFLAKSPRKLARYALLLHVLHHPDAEDGAEICEQTMAKAVIVIDYLRAHLAKVLPTFGAEYTPRPVGVTARVRRLLEQRQGPLNKADGGWMSATAISDALGGHTPAAEYLAALEALVSNGAAEHRSVHTGKRPREEWRWIPAEIRTFPEKAESPTLPVQPAAYCPVISVSPHQLHESV